MTAINESKITPRTRNRAKPARAGADHVFQARLLLGAELMRRVEDLDEMIQAAMTERALDAEEGGNALLCLDEMRDYLVDGVPLR